jgi:hypothetical protein
MPYKLQFEIHQAVSAITAAWARKTDPRDVRRIVQFSQDLLAAATWQGERSASLFSAHAATLIYLIEASEHGGDMLAVADFWVKLWGGVSWYWPPSTARRGR